MIMQALAGGIFGYIAVKRGLSQKSVRKIALKTAGNTLTWGGLAFILAGIFGLVLPKLATKGINTGIHVHNLDNLGLAFVLVMVCVIGVGFITLVRQTRLELAKLKTS
jgi:ABC-type Fe3+ transport system permease subunit